jgi:hypothetical protein
MYVDQVSITIVCLLFSKLFLFCNHALVYTAFQINIPSGYNRATEFVIVSASGEEYHLQPAENTP